MLSEPTVSRYVRRFRQRYPDPDVLDRWIAFLRNHNGAIAGMDFFTVPTATMNVLYGFFIIQRDRRRLHLIKASGRRTTSALLFVQSASAHGRFTRRGTLS